jgi:hypothetical protein
MLKFAYLTDCQKITLKSFKISFIVTLKLANKLFDIFGYLFVELLTNDFESQNEMSQKREQ